MKGDCWKKTPSAEMSMHCSSCIVGLSLNGCSVWLHLTREVVQVSPVKWGRGGGVCSLVTVEAFQVFLDEKSHLDTI